MNHLIKMVTAVTTTVLKNWEEVQSDDDSEEELLILLTQRKPHSKIDGYVQKTVFYYDLSDFKSHFRMSRTSVEELCYEIMEEDNISIPGRPSISKLEAILLTIWTLANQESFRGIGDRFGISKGNAHTVFIHICKKLCHLQAKYIMWPDGNDLRKTVTEFNQLRGLSYFPNVVGCVDGTHIEISGPTGDNSYYNRKGYHSIILQGVCNSKHEFINVFCGWPGSCHDARVWQNSPIFNKLKNENLIPKEYHLLGDSAYPLSTFLMVPFRDNGHLTIQQKKFNRILSSSRVVIEQSFGRLVGIFRRLKYLHLQNLTYFKYIVVAACILHNFIIKKKEFEFESVDIEQVNVDVVAGEIVNNNDRLARNKREYIMLNLR